MSKKPDRKLIHADSFDCYGDIETTKPDSNEYSICQTDVCLRNRDELLKFFKARPQLQFFQDGSLTLTCPRLTGGEHCGFPADQSLRYEVLKEMGLDSSEFSIVPIKCRFLREGKRVNISGVLEERSEEEGRRN